MCFGYDYVLCCVCVLLRFAAMCLALYIAVIIDCLVCFVVLFNVVMLFPEVFACSWLCVMRVCRGRV